VTETITDSDIDNAIELIKASKKPYIFVGGGVVLSGASKELKEFVDEGRNSTCLSIRSWAKVAYVVGRPK